jgi:hypothetical protein
MAGEFLEQIVDHFRTVTEVGAFESGERVSEIDPNASEAQALQAPAFAFRVFTRVLDPDVMSFEEPIEFVAGLNSQQSLQLGFGEPIAPVLLGQPGFQCPARKIATACAGGGSQYRREYARSDPCCVFSLARTQRGPQDSQTECLSTRLRANFPLNNSFLFVRTNARRLCVPAKSTARARKPRSSLSSRPGESASNRPRRPDVPK